MIQPPWCICISRRYGRWFNPPDVYVFQEDIRYGRWFNPPDVYVFQGTVKCVLLFDKNFDFSVGFRSAGSRLYIFPFLPQMQLIREIQLLSEIYYSFKCIALLKKKRYKNKKDWKRELIQVSLSTIQPIYCYMFIAQDAKEDKDYN